MRVCSPIVIFPSNGLDLNTFHRSANSSHLHSVIAKQRRIGFRRDDKFKPIVPRVLLQGLWEHLHTPRRARETRQSLR